MFVGSPVFAVKPVIVDLAVQYYAVTTLELNFVIVQQFVSVCVKKNTYLTKFPPNLARQFVEILRVQIVQHNSIRTGGLLKRNM